MNDLLFRAFLTSFSYYTMFENHPECRIWIFAFSINFYPIKIDLSGNTLWPIWAGIIYKLLFIQNVVLLASLAMLIETFCVIFKHCEYIYLPGLNRTLMQFLFLDRKVPPKEPITQGVEKCPWLVLGFWRPRVLLWGHPRLAPFMSFSLMQ